MSDSNTVPQAATPNPTAPAAPIAAQPQAPTPAPVAPAPAAAETPKTFTQRFQEIEKSTYQMQYVLQFHSQIMQNLVKELTEAKETLKAVREVSGAMMKLAADGKPATQDNIALKIAEMQAENFKQIIANDLKENRIKPIEAVKDNRDLIVFSTTDVLYGYQLLETFKEEKAELMGKKVGDKVGNVTIVGLYEEVVAAPQQPAPGVPNVQTPPNPAQQPQ